jgi:hypothetical protein
MGLSGLIIWFGVIFLLVIGFTLFNRKKVMELQEQNAFKSDLTWKDKNGNTHTERVLFKRSKIPLIGDWARIYPLRNEDGTLNKLNYLFGGRKNFLKLLLVLGIIALLLFGVYEILNGAKILAENPCVVSCITQNETQALNLPTWVK